MSSKAALKIRKVGNSLGVIFPKEIQETLNISEGDVIDITTMTGASAIINTHLPHHSKWLFKDVAISDEDNQWLDAELVDDHAPRW